MGSFQKKNWNKWNVQGVSFKKVAILYNVIKVAFIIHGAQKLSKHAREALALAEASEQLDVVKYTTERSKHAIELAINTVHQVDIVAAVGGDGTCNEVVQGIVESGNHDVSFALIPNGTGNDFARMLRNFDPQEFIKSLSENNSKLMDVGCSDFGDHKRYFANIADVGFGARVVEIMNRQRRNKMGGKIS